MAKDRLQRRIAEALQGSSVRDELKRILAGHDASKPSDAHVLHPILDSVKDPILSVAPDGTVQDANAAAGRLLGAAVEEIVRQDVARFIPQLVPAQPALEALADRVADTFVDASPELIQAQRKGGAPLTVEVTVSRAGYGP